MFSSQQGSVFVKQSATSGAGGVLAGSHGCMIITRIKLLQNIQISKSECGYLSYSRLMLKQSSWGKSLGAHKCTHLNYSDFILEAHSKWWSALCIKTIELNLSVREKIKLFYRQNLCHPDNDWLLYKYNCLPLILIQFAQKISKNDSTCSKQTARHLNSKALKKKKRNYQIFYREKPRKPWLLLAVKLMNTKNQFAFVNHLLVKSFTWLKLQTVATQWHLL